MKSPHRLLLVFALPFLLALAACGPSEEWTENQNIGNTAYQTGDFAAAEASFQAALAIAQEGWVTYPFVAISLDSLALVRTQLAQYPEAELYIRQALSMTEDAVGQSTSEYATRLSNLGNALHRQGRSNEAAQALTRALAIQSEVLGEDHTDAAITLNNLGEAQRGMGQLRDAEQSLNHAVAIAKSKLGEAHPNHGIFLNNLAG
ncbi:MAG: tetratricopeptide repeat protein, partial [Alphaproteobacteria bacterium]|nr:tetratricopeptide repeat protein [Alphaproteobacteria bacterium]